MPQPIPPPLVPPQSVEEITPVTVTVEEGRETRVRKFKIRYEDIDDLLEWAYPKDVAAGGVYVRAPRIHFPNRPWLRLSRLSIQPMDKDYVMAPDNFGVAQTNYVTVELTYTTWKSDILTVEVDTSAEFLKFPNMNFAKTTENQTDPKTQLEGNPGTGTFTATNCAGGDKPTPTMSIFKLIPLTNWTINWYNVTMPPWEAMSQKVGMVNEHNILASPPECVLYLGTKISQKTSPYGDICFDLAHKFSVRMIRYSIDPQVRIGSYPALGPIQFSMAGIATATNSFTGGVSGLMFINPAQERIAGWNHAMRPDTDKCTRVWTKVDPPPYESTSFVELFRPGTLDMGKLFLRELGMSMEDFGTQPQPQS